MKLTFHVWGCGLYFPLYPTLKQSQIGYMQSIQCSLNHALTIHTLQTLKENRNMCDYHTSVFHMEKADLGDKSSSFPNCLNTLNTLNQTYSNSTLKRFLNVINT